MDRAKNRRVSYSKTAFLEKRLALTAGEGIGKKALSLALKALGVKKGFQFLIWTKAGEEDLSLPGFQTLAFKSGKEALKNPFKAHKLLQIKSRLSPGDWLKEASQIVLSRQATALVTGPVNKSSLKKYKAVGQTDLLKKLCGAKQAFMCFRGHLFNVILWTDHTPLKKVSIKTKAFEAFLRLALKSREFLSPPLQNRPLGVLGLNPHAGEGGLMGKEEEKILKPAFQAFSKKEIQGPLAPDTAFLKKNWGLYSFFIALYHDQGLIPFKMAHSHKGFAQTLGLPFLRLGVEHGTGRALKDKDISGQSFLNAIKEAMRLSALSNRP